MRKTFLLTGSARGLGRSIAIAVLEAGHQLIATARRPESLDDIVERYGDRILPVALDVRSAGAAESAAQTGLARFGRIDVVVNNAGFANVGAVEDMPMEAVTSQLETNFLGSVRIIKAALPVLHRQGAGRIIQISSIGARIATAGAAAYYASKWALSGFVESLCLEVAPLGIKVTAIEPGGMKTDFAEDRSLTLFASGADYDATVGAIIRMMKAPHYLDSYADPDDVAAVVLKVADLDEPPVRLLVGGRNWDHARAADDARRLEDDRWRWLSVSGDRGDAR